MSLKAAIIPVTPFQQNCSILFDESNMTGAVVDPGGDLERIQATATELGVTISKILVTHAHLDHASGVSRLAATLDIPVEGPHRDDQFWIDQIPEQCERHGFPPAEKFVPDRWLDDGDSVTVGSLTLGVRHCPGHTPGHVVFYSEKFRIAAVGDVLFRGSIGRCDFPRGDQPTLINSIVERLWPLGNDMQFIPGHGPVSTFGDERQNNPFVGDAVVNAN